MNGIIPQVSISVIPGYAPVAAISGGFRKVWEGWDSPLEGLDLPILGHRFSRVERSDKCLQLVAGDGSQKQWEVWAPSPCLFVSQENQPWSGLGRSWTGYIETGHLVDEAVLTRFYRDDNFIAEVVVHEVYVRLDGIASVKRGGFSTSWGPMTSSEILERIAVEDELVDSMEHGRSYVIKVYTWRESEVHRFVRTNPGGQPTRFESEEELLAEAVQSTAPQRMKLLARLDALEESIRTGKDEDIRHEIRCKGFGPGARRDYSLVCPTGSSASLAIDYHRGEIAKTVKTGSVSTVWG